MFVEHDEGMHGVYWLNDYIMSNEQCIIKSLPIDIKQCPFCPVQFKGQCNQCVMLIDNEFNWKCL